MSDPHPWEIVAAEECPTCGGTGLVPTASMECPECGGRGWLRIGPAPLPPYRTPWTPDDCDAAEWEARYA